MAGVLGTLVAVGMPLAAQDGVYINGERVTQREIAAELAQYGVPVSSPIPPGAYWYDKVSGLWGYEGGPTLGQVMPGLDVGGRLRSNASGGGTGVFLNGREIHRLEYVYLYRLFGYVIPGRYWLNAQGVGGPEGGPPMFNLVAAARQAGVGGGSGGGGYNRRSLFGDTGSDGNCFYYNHPNGSSVSNC